MTRKVDSRQSLIDLVQALDDEFEALTDDEALAETREAGEDPDAIATRLGETIENAIRRASRGRLAQARDAMAERSTRPDARVNVLPLKRKEEILSRFAERRGDGRLRDRVTIAARHGEGASEAEMDAILQNLVRLGAIDPDGNEL